MDLLTVWNDLQFGNSHTDYDTHEDSDWPEHRGLLILTFFGLLTLLFDWYDCRRGRRPVSSWFGIKRVSWNDRINSALDLVLSGYVWGTHGLMSVSIYGFPACVNV